MINTETKPAMTNLITNSQLLQLLDSTFSALDSSPNPHDQVIALSLSLSLTLSLSLSLSLRENTCCIEVSEQDLVMCLVDDFDCYNPLHNTHGSVASYIQTNQKTHIYIVNQ